MRVWSIGEALWDIFPDQERFGGAPLNFCANLSRMGHDATLLSAVGLDERGCLALEMMVALGLSSKHVRQVADLPTGVALITHNSVGEPQFVIPRPAAFDALSTDPALYEVAKTEATEWLYYGTLLQTFDSIEKFTTGFAQNLPDVRCFYDMNLRTGHWNLPVVQRLSALASVIKLNENEAETLFSLTQPDGRSFSLDAFCMEWSTTYKVDVLCITLGSAGCLVYDGASMLRVPGFKIQVCDTVGAGDAFAAAFLHGYHEHWPLLQTARFANAVGALVASRPGATPEWSIDECLLLTQTS